MTDLFKRSLTGAAFVLIMISMVCLSIYSLTGILLFILITSTYEFLYLTGMTRQITVSRTVIFCSSFMFIGIFFVRIGILPEIFILWSVLFGISFSAIIIKIFKNDFFEWFIKTIGAYIYLVIPLSLSLYLVNYSKGVYESKLLISLFALIWVYDSFAYLTGSLFGKHKIIPAISPKKTWEGLIGGFVFTIFSAYIISKIYLNNFTPAVMITISLIVVIAGTTGDIFESYLKRKAGVKDSGRWLPGHGGILDRFDSYLFIIPPAYIYLRLIQNLC